MTERAIDVVDLAKMSDPHAMRAAMASWLSEDPEQWARLQGLFAMLALPPVRCEDGRHRRRLVEVEVSPNRWVAVDGASIDIEKLVVWTGTNGSRLVFEFVRGEGVPRWRAPSDRCSTFIAE